MKKAPPNQTGLTRSLETRQKISSSSRGKSRNAGENNPIFGKKSDQNANFGRKASKQTIKAQSDAQQCVYSLTKPAGKPIVLKTRDLKEFCVNYDISFDYLLACGRKNLKYKGYGIEKIYDPKRKK